MADFECFLCPPSTADDEPNVDAFHIPSRFCVFHVTDDESYRTDPVVYSGDDVMGKFFSHIFAEAKAISRILSCDVSMAALTASGETEYVNAMTCARLRALIKRRGATITSRANICSRHVVIATWH